MRTAQRISYGVSMELAFRKAQQVKLLNYWRGQVECNRRAGRADLLEKAKAEVARLERMMGR